MPLYYFAYGSNLSVEQMAERCPEAEPAGTAILHDFALAFGGHSPHWDGAPATVIRESGCRVPGLLYRLPFTELRMLDYYEGHPIRYERRQKTVDHESDERRRAHVYVKDVDGVYGRPPDSYFSVLKQAYDDLGFDPRLLQRAVELGDRLQEA